MNKDEEIATLKEENRQHVESITAYYRIKADKDAELTDLKERVRELEADLEGVQNSYKTGMELYLALKAENTVLRETYNELIMAVESKFPGETRHETALRYIQQGERRDSSPAREALGQKEEV
jgi:DNA-binding FadR family transcriptional regulator